MNRRKFLEHLFSFGVATGSAGIFGINPRLTYQTVEKEPARKVWSNEQIIINTKSKVVHWPHPGLFEQIEALPEPHHSMIWNVDQWRDIIQDSTEYHFHKSRSARIMEQLALRAIKFKDELNLSFDLESLDQAITILRLFLSKPYHNFNAEAWGIYDLLGRLLCLKNENNSEKARSEFLKVLNIASYAELFAETLRELEAARFISEPQATRDVPFLILSDEVFSIQGRGMVVTGRVARGLIQVSDEVEIIGAQGEILKTVVTGIEIFGQSQDQAEAGDNADILLTGIGPDEVEPGMVLTQPGSVYRWESRIPLAWANDIHKFKEWHAKTTDRMQPRSREKLAERIKFAQSLA